MKALQWMGRGWLAALCVLAWGAAGEMAVASESLCAKVTIVIEQTLTLERQAFDAHLRLNNGLPNTALDDIAVTVWAKDKQGNPVEISDDPNSSSAAFFIRLYETERVTGLSGNLSVSGGRVNPTTSGNIHWLIIPAPGAAGDSPDGKDYLVGASIRYRTGDLTVELEVDPDTINVRPMPLLGLDYFLPCYANGDNAFTRWIEPEEPFSLGVRVNNGGAGAAKNLKIDSAQPRLKDNAQDLLIDFELVGSRVMNQPGSPSLLMDFGSIPGRSAKVGRWDMRCSLSGEFTSFSASFSHADELGGRLTSLMTNITTHFLLRDVIVDLAGRDDVEDFLTADIANMEVYESDGGTHEVENLGIQSPAGGTGLTRTWSVTPRGGFVYLRWNENNWLMNKAVERVVRDDGSEVDLRNAWVASYVKKGSEGQTTRDFNLFDYGGGTYTVTFKDLAASPEAPQLQQTGIMGTWTYRFNEAKGYLLEASDRNGDSPVITVSGLPSGATLTERATFQAGGYGMTEALFEWTPTMSDAGAHEVTFTATDNTGLTDTERVIIYVGPRNMSDAELLDHYVNPPVLITDLRPLGGVHRIQVSWEAQAQTTYEIYATPDLVPLGASFGTLPGAQTRRWTEAFDTGSTCRWEHVGSVEAQWADYGQQLSFIDEVAETNFFTRYYRVVPVGDPPDSENAWAVIRRAVPVGLNALAPPVRTDRRLDGNLGAMLASGLSGDNGGIGDEVGDELYLWNTNNTWDVVYLDAAGTWRNANGSASTNEVDPGQGMQVMRNGATPTLVTFYGSVITEAALTGGEPNVRIREGWNMVGLQSGRSLDIQRFFQAGIDGTAPSGGFREQDADQIFIQEENGTWRKLFYVQGWGPAYDNRWFDLKTFTPANFHLRPGQALYYRRKAGEAPIQYSW